MPDKHMKDKNYPLVTIGIVEDVSDAFQLGRLKIRCQAWLDGDIITEDLPFARFCSPFFGFTDSIPRGVNGDKTEGPVAYGQWAIPKVGSQALVTLIDNDPNQRIWMGNVPELFLSNTLPHGRFLSDKQPVSSTGQPIEPLATNSKIAFRGRDSAEYITRILDRQAASYSPETAGNRNKIADEPDALTQTFESPDGTTVSKTQGYTSSGSDIFSLTTPGFHSISMDDSAENCRTRLRTTAGHQIIMDDTNERIYISTSKGKTWIEIDEKGTIDIYGEQDISIRSDADLNLSARDNVRIAGGKGVHVTSGADMRFHAKNDMHVRSDTSIRTQAASAKTQINGDYSLNISGSFDTLANLINIKSETNYDLTVSDVFKMRSTGYGFDGSSIKTDADIFSLGNIHAMGNVTALGNVAAAGSIIATGGMSAGGGMSATGPISTSGIISSSADIVAGNVGLRFHTHQYILPTQGGSPAPTAPPLPTSAAIPPTPAPALQQPIEPSASPSDVVASDAEAKPAYFVSRTPTHEPFTRSYLKKDITDKEDASETALTLFEIIENDIEAALEYSASDNNAGSGSADRGKDFLRNPKWHR